MGSFFGKPKPPAVPAPIKMPEYKPPPAPEPVPVAPLADDSIIQQKKKKEMARMTTGRASTFLSDSEDSGLG